MHRTESRGLSRGDRRRNEKLRLLREAVPDGAAICAIDLADADQDAVVTGPDGAIRARRRFKTSPWGIDQMLDWAQGVAQSAGIDSLVVACEPTGHRWKPVVARTRDRGLGVACIPPMLVAREREREDLTTARSDTKDATCIARLARERRCYLPNLPAAGWARLRHLGARRHQKLEARTAARQELQDLLRCYWPAALEAAATGVSSTTLRACLRVSTDPQATAEMSLEELTRAAREHLPDVGGVRLCHRIVGAFHRAGADPRRLPDEEPGAAERAAYALEDLLWASGRVQEVEDAMVGLLEALGYAELCTSVPGLSAVGAAAILAETGDPIRYDSPRTWVKHAGIAPRENASGRFRGETRVSGRGRPLLRTAAWRAVWALLPNNAVFRARFRRLRSRSVNPLTPHQARTALAAALLRQLWVLCVHRVRWDSALASGEEVMPAA